MGEITNLLNKSAQQQQPKASPPPSAADKVKKSAGDELILESDECDVCHQSFETKKALQSHLASTVHRLKVERQQQQHLVKAYYAIPRSNAGFQMMLKDGWNQDTGLG